MSKIDRKRTRCCSQYVCICASKASFESKYPWKKSTGPNATKYNTAGPAGISENTDTTSRRTWKDGNNKKRGLRVNKLPWK